MKGAGIISREQALRILKKDLRKAALEKRSVELSAANSEVRESILAQIEREIDHEIRKRARQFDHQDVLY
jgi:hypothetical protein